MSPHLDSNWSTGEVIVTRVDPHVPSLNNDIACPRRVLGNREKVGANRHSRSCCVRDIQTCLVKYIGYKMTAIRGQPSTACIAAHLVRDTSIFIVLSDIERVV